jgi:hypothetical protein
VALFTTRGEVTLYNSSSDQWSHVHDLSVARRFLAATSVGNVAIFAGGFDDNGNPVFLFVSLRIYVFCLFVRMMRA